MTLVSAIIRAGFRESNTIATAQIIQADETAEALKLLQGVILSSVGAEIGYIMEDWNISDTSYIRPSGVPIPASKIAAFTIKPNSRLICNLSAPLTLKLDPLPQDGERFSAVDAKANFAVDPLTLNPNGRKIQGTTANLVLNVSSTTKQWIYRSDLADWVTLDALAETDQMPFPSDFDDYFAILLAMRINPRYGKQLDQQSQTRFQQQETQFINRYTQSRLRSVPTPAQNNPARTPGS